MVQAARSKTARISHQGLVYAYETLLAARGAKVDGTEDAMPSTPARGGSVSAPLHQDAGTETGSSAILSSEGVMKEDAKS